MGVSYNEESGTTKDWDDEEESTPRRSSPVWFIRKFFRKINTYLQITSPAYQHGATERKLSFIVFLLMFVCFIWTSFFLFSGGDVCSSHQQGLDRLRAERDHLAAELEALRPKQPNPPANDDGAVIP